jgi:hypothetical protein
MSPTRIKVALIVAAVAIAAVLAVVYPCPITTYTHV